MKLTIGLLVSNRIELVKRCLESVKPLLDRGIAELICLDTVSATPGLVSDGSAELAGKYATRVIEFPWVRDFAKARNTTLAYATGEWYMYLDDDEWFDSVDEFVTFFESGEYRKYSSATYITRNYVDMEATRWSDQRVARMVKRTPELKFVGRIHESFSSISLPCKDFNIFTHHYGYAYSTEEDKARHRERNLSILTEEVAAHPEDLRLCTKLALEYASYDNEKALEYTLKTLKEFEKSQSEPYFQWLIALQFRLYEALEKGPEKVLALYNDVHERYEVLEYAELTICYCMARQLLIAEDPVGALPYLREYHRLRDILKQDTGKQQLQNTADFEKYLSDSICEEASTWLKYAENAASQNTAAHKERNMNTYQLDVFKDFECIGSACPENCCEAGWNIYVDDVTYEKYMRLPGELGEKIRANIVEAGDTHKLKMTDSGKCPFLDENNLCGIYKEIGPENMCFTCRTHPREVQMPTENDMLLRLSLSCPEVARILFSKKDKIQLLSAAGKMSEGMPEEMQATKELLLNGLIVSISIVQNRRLGISDRLKLLIMFNNMLENEEKNGGDPEEVIEAFMTEEGQLALADNLAEFESAPALLTKFFLILYNHFIQESGHMKLMAGEVLGVVNKRIAAGGLCMESLVRAIQDEDYDIYMEQYMVYMIFGSYFNAGMEINLVKMLELPIYMYCLNACFLALYTEGKKAKLSFDEVTVVYAHLSKYIEHNKKQCEDILKLSDRAGLSDITALLGLLALK